MTTTSLEEVQNLIVKMVAEEMDVPMDTISLEDDFHKMGMDSISSIFMLNELEETYSIELKPMHLWDNPTIATFANFVLSIIHENE